MGFMMGLSISLVLAAFGFYYYQTKVHNLREAEKDEIRKEAVDQYIQEHPTSLVYVFGTSRKAGDVLKDNDLIPAEIGSPLLPADAVTDLSEAMGRVLRCDVTANTAATFSLMYDEGDYPDDMRLMEYTVIKLPQKLEARQFIDVRIMFPNGLDYIVLSKKMVEDFDHDAESQKNIVWFHSGEEEILRMASAIVDASVVEGAYLYAVPYVAPDIQKEAVKTYPSNSEVQNLIANNPNIVAKAVTQLEARNRSLFEEQINRDMQSSGRSAVFGEDINSASPVYAPGQPGDSATAQPPTSGQPSGSGKEPEADLTGSITKDRL